MGLYRVVAYEIAEVAEFFIASRGENGRLGVFREKKIQTDGQSVEQPLKILRGIWWFILTAFLIREVDQKVQIASPLTGCQTGRYY